jgi:hypothetical protein
VVDNSEGFDMHRLDSGQYIRTLSTGYPLWRLPKQVIFAEDATIIVGGSDHGAIYLWDRRSGVLLAKLAHADQGLVQTVTVR